MQEGRRLGRANGYIEENTAQTPKGENGRHEKPHGAAIAPRAQSLPDPAVPVCRGAGRVRLSADATRRHARTTGRTCRRKHPAFRNRGGADDHHRIDADANRRACRAGAGGHVSTARDGTAAAPGNRFAATATRRSQRRATKFTGTARTRLEDTGSRIPVEPGEPETATRSRRRRRHRPVRERRQSACRRRARRRALYSPDDRRGNRAIARARTTGP